MESHEDEITRLSAGSRETTVDRNGVVRYPDNGRAVRSDKGIRRRHPSGCAHCSMVESYRLQRDTEVQAREVACADEDLVLITFKEWLCAYRYEPVPDVLYPIAA